MRLNDILAQAIEETRQGSRIVTHDAVEAALPLIEADVEIARQVLREGISKRIKDKVTRLARAESSRPAAQASLPFPGLRPHHALDLDGRVLKETAALTRLEWERIRQIRREQIVNDTAYLKVLDDVTEMIRDIWDANPQLTFGEAATLWEQNRPAA